MITSDVELLLPFLEKSAYDLRIWRKSHLYTRVDRKEQPDVFISGELLIVWHGGNMEELPIQHIKKVTISSTINIVLETD